MRIDWKSDDIGIVDYIEYHLFDLLFFFYLNLATDYEKAVVNIGCLPSRL